MHKDFNDLLSAFNEFEVMYLIVGGYAYARYTEPRATKDLGLFISAHPENASVVYQALGAFGASLRGVNPEDFATPGVVFQIGVAPFRVDIINRIDGLTFEAAWGKSEADLVDSAVPVRYISLNHLIINKVAAGRPQDLVDVQNLRHAAEAIDL